MNWAGGTNVVASTLTAQSALNVSGGSNNVNADGIVNIPALNFTGSNSPTVVVVADASVPGKINLSGGMSFNGTGTASLQSTATGSQSLGILYLYNSTCNVSVSAGATLSVSTTIAAGGLSVSGTGTMELVSPNSYSLGTTINTSTTVQADDPSSLGQAGSGVNFNGGTLALRNDSQAVTYAYALTPSSTAGSTSIDIDRLHSGSATGTFTVSSLGLGLGERGIQSHR